MSQNAMEPPEQGPRPARLRDPIVASLQARLSLPIVNDDVSLAALTHKSFVNEHRGEGMLDNERLEFLGDAVIDLAVSHRLMERFPEAREGELSKIRAAVVDEAGLARMARELDLGALLRLGRGEELTGGRQKSSLLADAMEAVVAALYLGGGLEPVLCLLDRFLGEAFARAAAGTLDRDYKTQLQELAQSKIRASPRYRVIAEHGPDHSKIFEVELELKGEVIGRGAGRSKKDAEQAAAKLALEAMNGRLVEAKLPVEVVVPPIPENPPPPQPPVGIPEAPPPKAVSELIEPPAPPEERPEPQPEIRDEAEPAELSKAPASRRKPRQKARASTEARGRKTVSRSAATARRRPRKPAKK